MKGACNDSLTKTLDASSCQEAALLGLVLGSKTAEWKCGNALDKKQSQVEFEHILKQKSGLTLGDQCFPL